MRTMRTMRARLVLCVLLLAGAAGGVRRPDHDFEFDDADAAGSPGAGGAHRARRYSYEPHNPLCRSLVCKKRQVCVLRDAFTALCADKKDVARRGDGAEPGGARERDDDVFYDAGARDDRDDRDAGDAGPRLDGCVGCGPRTRARFVCGSDNRTYSSLCRLDLHNCVRRGAGVRLACRGFCPCGAGRRARGRGRGLGLGRTANELAPRRAACALDEMADRLLDWFSVLAERARVAPPPPRAFPAGCKPEVRWMFAHLDADGDGLLSAADLYALRHDERERCLRPFLASCGDGAGAGGAGGVSRAAWCGCLRRAARPCTALARAHPDARDGAYVPACDSRGYYRPRQCHAALGVCWCVDAHGAELPGSRGKGARACPHAGRQAALGAPADDEDGAGAGSGDGADGAGGGDGGDGERPRVF